MNGSDDDSDGSDYGGSTDDDDDDGDGDQFYHSLTCTYIYSYIPTTTNRQKVWRQRFATTKIQALWRRALVRTALYDPYKVSGWMNEWIDGWMDRSKCGLRVKSCHDMMAVDSLQSYFVS